MQLEKSLTGTSQFVLVIVFLFCIIINHEEAKTKLMQYRTRQLHIKHFFIPMYGTVYGVGKITEICVFFFQQMCEPIYQIHSFEFQRINFNHSLLIICHSYRYIKVNNRSSSFKIQLIYF